MKVESSHSVDTQRSTSAMVTCKQILDPPEPNRKPSADGSLCRCWPQTPPGMDTCMHTSFGQSTVRRPAESRKRHGPGCNILHVMSALIWHQESIATCRPRRNLFTIKPLQPWAQAAPITYTVCTFFCEWPRINSVTSACTDAVRADPTVW